MDKAERERIAPKMVDGEAVCVRSMCPHYIDCDAYSVGNDGVCWPYYRAALDESEASIAKLEAEVERWQEREASCCPEDVGFEEMIATLSARGAELESGIATMIYRAINLIDPAGAKWKKGDRVRCIVPDCECGGDTGTIVGPTFDDWRESVEGEPCWDVTWDSDGGCKFVRESEIRAEPTSEGE